MRKAQAVGALLALLLAGNVYAQLARISTGNSTTTVLAGNATFTGTWDDFTQAGGATVTVISNAAGASNGLKFQWSTNGVDVDSVSLHTFSDTTNGQNFAVTVAARYFRVVYVNGASVQTSFRLQTIMKPSSVASASGGDSFDQDLNTTDSPTFDVLHVASCVGCDTGSGAPTDSPYITKTSVGGLSAEFALGSLATGLLNVTTTTGDLTSLTPTDDNMLVGNGTAWQKKALSDCTGTGKAVTYDASTNVFGCNTITGNAPTDATYITKTANGSLSAEFALGSLSTGIMNVATTTGDVTSITPSDDNLLVGNGTDWQKKALTDCQGTGKAVTYTASSNTWGCNTITGGGGGTGTVTSIGTTAPLAGGTITDTGTITCTTCMVNPSALTANGLTYSAGGQILASVDPGTLGQVCVSQGSSSPCAFSDSANVLTYLSCTGAFTISVYGKAYRCTGTSADYAVTLPTCDSGHLGSSIHFTMADTLTKIVTITPASMQTINSISTYPMHDQETVTIVCEVAGNWKRESGRPIAFLAQSELQATQTIATSDTVKVLLDTNNINVGGMWRSATSDFIVKRTGNYFIKARVSGVLDTADELHVLVTKTTKDGSQILRYIATASKNTQEMTPESSDTIPLVVGDIILLVEYHTHSGSISSPSNAVTSPCRISIEEKL